MKKLVLALGAAVCAVSLQAASINWTISNVYSASDSTAKASGAAAYLFVTANSTDVSGITITTLEAVTAAIESQDWTTVASLSSANNTLNTSGSMLSAATGISSSFSSGSLSAFAVVFDASSLDAATSYYLVNEGATKSVSFTSSTGAKNLAFGSQATNSAIASNWTAVVPEPTSGLLMLLGVAGLALRRRRA